MSRFDDYRRGVETGVMKSATPNVVRDCLDEIDRLQAIVDRLRFAAEKAASAPGVDWLFEQIELAAVLVEVDREAAEKARKA